NLVHSEEDEDRDQPRHPEELAAKGRHVLVLQGTVEGVVPLIQKNGEIDHAEREEHDTDQEPPGGPTVPRGPVRADDGPSARKRSPQARPGRSFGARPPVSVQAFSHETPLRTLSVTSPVGGRHQRGHTRRDSYFEAVSRAVDGTRLKHIAIMIHSE